jgi:hypothetical protein
MRGKKERKKAKKKVIKFKISIKLISMYKLLCLRFFIRRIFLIACWIFKIYTWVQTKFLNETSYYNY